ncbi:DUF4192 domain-containing protein [Streptomyces sp. 891-h]|uniref:DUF4192 domain-containing protein n=1 Tax=unclassified Streptomyces TaxID=2593676 RepID=UPI001FAB09B2|nr:DUF4192 domain-containing protein [Streptomyces sp. 891-h]UNZ16994.1 DUF4192 domain-containing protein [Streptomyces sp. 891-h]
MTHHDRESRGNEPTPSSSSDQTSPQPSVSLRDPSELAEALPYLLGFYPDDSLVVVALHGERGRFGGRLRIGIPDDESGWAAFAPQIAECLETSSRARGDRPDGALIFLCQEPGEGHSGRDVMERLHPLVQQLRRACGELEMPVYEALCLSEGRYFSYCCPDPRCCPPEGRPLAQSGTSAMAVAAAYAGLPMHGSLREMEKRLTPLGPPFAEEQIRVLDSVSAELSPRMLSVEGRPQVRTETLALLGQLLERFQRCSPTAETTLGQDAHDDGLLSHDECAAAVLGLQDRETRDQAAEWMEGADVAPALRLWRALARRCAGPYLGYSAALLTLAGWVAWSGGDVPTARVALGLALRTDPDYLFAQLLHHACNEGLDPKLVRQCLRNEEGLKEAEGKREKPDDAADDAGC